jgi:aspartate/methionine/tyrosine aminotransferase
MDLIDAFAKKVKAQYQTIIHECMEILGTSSAVRCAEPDAGLYLFMDVSRTHLDDIDFTKQLLEKHKTAVTPGASFGYKGFVRASICGEPKNVKEGIRRLVNFANSLYDNVE